jgi:hypothetical protein
MNEAFHSPFDAQTPRNSDVQRASKSIFAQISLRFLCVSASLRQMLRHIKPASNSHASPAPLAPCWVHVRGASMTPALRSGDQVLVDFTRPWACGDVVVVGARRALVVHRIVAVRSAGNDGEVFTRGDAVGRADRPVRVGAIVGVVVRVRRRRWWGRWQEWEAPRAVE